MPEPTLSNAERSDRQRQQDRHAALIALLADPAPVADQDAPGAADLGTAELGDRALDDEELAALIDGRLSGARRARVLTRLDRDPAAYQAWLAAAAALRQSNKRRASRAALRWRPLTALAAGLAAMLVLGLWLLSPLSGPDLATRIDQALAAVQGSGAAPDALGQGYGFTTSGPADAVSEATRAGFQAGVQALAGRPRQSQQPSSEPHAELEPPFQLGRWIALLGAASRVEPPPDAAFWQAQLSIAAGLKQALAALDNGNGAATLRHALQELRPALAPLAEAPTGRNRRTLAARVEQTRARLGLETAE